LHTLRTVLIALRTLRHPCQSLQLFRFALGAALRKVSRTVGSVSKAVLSVQLLLGCILKPLLLCAQLFLL
jgi:hypothetical protein